MTKILTVFVLVAVAAYVTAETLNVIDVYNKAVFQIGVVRNKKPVIVYFHNSKCKYQSCEWIGPQLGRVTKRKSEQLYFAKVDTDKIPSLAEEYGVQTYPTVMAFKDGDIIDVIEGPKWGQIVELVNRVARL